MAQQRVLPLPNKCILGRCACALVSMRPAYRLCTWRVSTGCIQCAPACIVAPERTSHRLGVARCPGTTDCVAVRFGEDLMVEPVRDLDVWGFFSASDLSLCSLAESFLPNVNMSAEDQPGPTPARACQAVRLKRPSHMHPEEGGMHAASALLESWGVVTSSQATCARYWQPR